MEGEKATSCDKAMKGKSDHVFDTISGDALLWLNSTAADPPLSFWECDSSQAPELQQKDSDISESSAVCSLAAQAQAADAELT